jgi:hypothetical protein
MRARSLAWSWWKAMVRSSMAANRPTGIVISPKVIAPFQMARLVVTGCQAISTFTPC